MKTPSKERGDASCPTSARQIGNAAPTFDPKAAAIEAARQMQEQCSTRCDTARRKAEIIQTAIDAVTAPLEQQLKEQKQIAKEWFDAWGEMKARVESRPAPTASSPSAAATEAIEAAENLVAKFYSCVRKYDNGFVEVDSKKALGFATNSIQAAIEEAYQRGRQDQFNELLEMQPKKYPAESRPAQEKANSVLQRYFSGTSLQQ